MTKRDFMEQGFLNWLSHGNPCILSNMVTAVGAIGHVYDYINNLSSKEPDKKPEPTKASSGGQSLPY